MSDGDRHLGFSVVICAYTEKRWDLLRRAIESVYTQTYRGPVQLVLVIDHNDALLARVQREFHSAKIVANAGLVGLSDARNTGIGMATGDVIAFLDDDAQARPDWLSRIAEHYRDASVIGVGGAAEPEWDAGRRPRWFPEEFDWVIGCSYRGLPTRAAPVRNFLGCNMSFRREAFEVAGTFNTAVGRVGTRPVGCEETEFCIRLAQRLPDRSLVYEPAAAVLHHVPADRSSWRYYLARCHSEGISKAIVSQLTGSADGLASERVHALRVLPAGFARDLVAPLTRRDIAGPARAAAILVGLAFTVSGLVRERASARFRRGRGSASERMAT